MKNFCFQGNAHDCGFACLKMLLAAATNSKQFLYIPHPKDKVEEDYSFLELIEIAGTYHINVSAYQCKFSEMKKMDPPMMVKVTDNHMVVLTEVKKGIYYFNDPAVGKRKMKEEEFRQYYDNYVLIVEECSEAIVPEVTRPSFVSKSFYVTHLILGLVLIAVVLTGFYFTNENSSIVLTMGFLTCFILIELFENWYVLRKSDQFDEQYLPLFFSRKSERNYNGYKQYLETKTSLFATSKSALFIGGLALVMAILLIVNDYKNLIVIFILSILKIVDMMFFQEKEKKIEEKISFGEAHAFDDDKESISTLKSINKMANLHYLSLTSRSCLFNFTMMALVVLMMFVNKTISANYAVFHYGIYFIISQGLDMLVGYAKNKSKFEKAQTEFFDKCNL